MNNNESRTLWISIGAGLFAAFLLYSYSQEKKAEYDKQYGSTKPVIISRTDINEMQNIDDSMLEVVQRPTDFVEPGAAVDIDSVVGQIAAVPIKKGEQILLNKLNHPGPETGIALQVAPGKRAITISVDEIRAVAKLIRPGDRVDIYAAVDVGKGSNQRREVTLFMGDVVILATGISVVNTLPRLYELDPSGKQLTQINLSGDTKYQSVTIEATPKESQDLIYLMATSPGSLYFTLRNPNERNKDLRMPSSNAETFTSRLSGSYDASPAVAFPSAAVARPPVVQAPAPPPARQVVPPGRGR